MPTSVTLNGISYSVPLYLDTGWAQGSGNLSQYLIAIASSTLQQTGGTFTLTADVNFGASFGLLAAYFKTRASNPASAGLFRLAVGDTIDWRNNANSANLTLAVDGSDNLTWNGNIISTSSAGPVTSITGTAHQIIASASTGAVTLSAPQNIDTSSSPTFSGLTLSSMSTAGLVHNAVTTGVLSSSLLVNADVSSSAAIALFKLASTSAYYWYAANSSGVLTPLAVSASLAVISDSNGLPSTGSTTATEIGYVHGVTSAIQTQINTKAPTASPTFTGTVSAPVVDITNTSNQLVLGTTNTTTLSATAPSASRTYTIPDAGGSANVVLDAGNYTIGGTWTFSHSITLANSQALILKDSSGDAVTIECTASTTPYTLKLPTTSGTSNYFLQTDGSGNCTWAAGGAGTVSSGTAGQLAYYATSSSTVSGFATTIDNIFSYRRPNLVYSSSTAVTVETGLDGTSGDATILFPDGTFINDTTSGHVTMTISQNAVFTSATGSSNKGGLDTGSASADHWYACYAVKCTQVTGWVLVASLNIPIQANYSTLNTNFGTNGWVYLGMIRYGDESGSTTGILKFSQSGNHTSFYNNCTIASTGIGTAPGILMATNSSATSLSYSYSTGTANAGIPNNVFQGDWIAAGTNSSQINFSIGNGTYTESYGNNVYRILSKISNRTISETLTISGSSTGSTLDILLCGFTDGALGLGPNPLI